MINKIVKKSPLAVVVNSLLFGFGGFLFYIIAFVVYKDINNKQLSFPINELEFDLLTLGLLFSFEIVILITTFLQWYFESFVLTNYSIIHKKGIIFKTRRFYPVKSLIVIEYKQGPLGKLFKYGMLIIKKQLNSKGVKFEFFPDPEENAEYIKKLKDGVAEEKEFPLKALDKKLPEKISLINLLKRREDHEVEFKSSFRWDYKENQFNKALEKAVMKTIAGFMNTKGGYLVIGVDDDGNVLGLDKDYQSLPKKDSDGFENHFNQVFATMIGLKYRQFLTMEFSKKEEKEICMITVVPSYEPIYVTNNGEEEFFIRAGNGTVSLSLREATSYIKNNWK